MTILPADDPVGLKHVGGSNTNSEYNNTHCAFRWWFITFISVATFCRPLYQINIAPAHMAE